MNWSVVSEYQKLIKKIGQNILVICFRDIQKVDCLKKSIKSVIDSDTVIEILENMQPRREIAETIINTKS